MRPYTEEEKAWAAQMKVLSINERQAKGVYIRALPSCPTSPLGYGETYKQARANAVAFNAAIKSGRTYAYTYYPHKED